MGFLMYGQNGQDASQMTPEQRQQQMQQQFAQQILGQTPTTPVGGMGQLAAGLAMWRQRQQDQPQNQYPAAPGGAQPGLMTSIQNMFGNNGGLY